MDGLVALLATYAASFVESVEALTIVLAVGLTRGWRPALEGTLAALAVLAGLAAAAPFLLGRVPDRALLGGVGVVVLLVGARWLRKAVLRAGGVLALHDEEAEFARAVAAVAGEGGAARDWRALGIAFQGVLVEGIEVVLIVAGAAAGGRRVAPAIGGGLAAVASVALLGVFLRHPLSRVPENTLKLGVGVMLCSLGTFWAIEGMGYDWPLDAGSLLGLVAAYTAVATAGAAALRHGRRLRTRPA